MDLYGAFKNGIGGLSVALGAPKCPAKYDDGDVEVEAFAASLESYLISKKGSPKKWWSTQVIKLLLELHLDYTKDFGIGKQGVAFLDYKKADKNRSIREIKKS
jgi:hypothetical protein